MCVFIFLIYLKILKKTNLNNPTKKNDILIVKTQVNNKLFLTPTYMLAQIFKDLVYLANNKQKT